MNMGVTPFSADQSCRVGLGNQLFHLSSGGLGGAPVRQGRFCPDHLVYKKNIPPHGTGKSGGGHLKRTGEHPGRDSLLLQGTDLGVESLNIAGCAVGSVKAYHGGNPMGNNLGNLHLRRSAVIARLAARADHMDMLVHESRYHDQPGGFYNLNR